MALRIDKVVHDIDWAVDSELFNRPCPQPLGYRRDGVRFLDGPTGDRPKGRVAADERDVGTVQGSHHLEVQLGRGVFRHERSGSKGDRIVHVQHLQTLHASDRYDFRGQSEVVRIGLQQGILHRIDLMKAHALRDISQAQGCCIRDKGDLMAPPGEYLAQLGRHNAAAAMGWKTGDPDSHRISP